MLEIPSRESDSLYSTWYPSGLSTLSLLVVDRCRCGRWLVGIAAQVFRVETTEFYASVSRCELPIYLAVNLVA
jgi:hypothetical protein